MSLWSLCLDTQCFFSLSLPSRFLAQIYTTLTLCVCITYWKWCCCCCRPNETTFRLSLISDYYYYYSENSVYCHRSYGVWNALTIDQTYVCCASIGLFVFIEWRVAALMTTTTLRIACVVPSVHSTPLFIHLNTVCMGVYDVQYSIGNSFIWFCHFGWQNQCEHHLWRCHARSLFPLFIASFNEWRMSLYFVHNWHFGYHQTARECHICSNHSITWFDRTRSSQSLRIRTAIQQKSNMHTTLWSLTPSKPNTTICTTSFFSESFCFSISIRTTDLASTHTHRSRVPRK